MIAWWSTKKTNIIYKVKKVIIIKEDDPGIIIEHVF